MVYRIYVEKKPELAHEAQKLFSDAVNLLGISALERVRVLNRYDAEGMDEALFHYAVSTVFSEPQLDLTFTELDAEGGTVFAVEYLPGQFDQRADSAAQCIQIISHGEKPTVQTARVYVLYGALTEADVAAIKKYVINPVESREASLDTKTSLKMEYEVPEKVAAVTGLREMDAVLGNDEKYIADVCEAAAETHPKFIAVFGSPIAAMMGTDFKGVAKVIEKRTGIPTLHFDTSGMHSYQQGARQAFAALAERFVDEPAKTPSDQLRVNLLGLTPLDFSIVGNVEALQAWCDAEGFDVLSSWAMNSSLDDIARSGEADVNLVLSSTALDAAKELEKQGIDAEVLDLRSLVPLDFDAIAGSVKKTGRVIITHEAIERTGFGAEIAAEIADKLFDELDAPILRVCGANIPVPNATVPELESAPTVPRIVAAAKKLCQGGKFSG